jgi:TolB-like protein
MRARRGSLALLLGASLPLGACATPNSYALARTAARNAMRDEVLLRPERYEERALAVLPLTAAPGDSVGRLLGWALTELMAQDLARTRKLTVLDRTRVGALLQELALAKSGRVDSLTAPRAGRLLGASWVTVGSLERLADTLQYKVVVRTVNVLSGTVTPSFDGVIRLDDVTRGQTQLLQRLLASVGLSNAVIARSTAAVTPVTTDILLRLGRGVELMAFGDVEKGTAQLDALARERPGFTAAATASRENRAAPVASPEARRRDLREVAIAVIPLTPVRTAEAVDAAASSVVQLAQLNIVIMVP